MPTVENRDARFMQSLLAASEDCIKVLTLDGGLAFMSEGGQRTMEVSDFNAIKGCPWPDFWTGQGKGDVAIALSEANAGRSSRFQGYANTMAGRSRYWDVQVSPILGPDGRPEAILSVSRDITALKEAEDRLRLIMGETQHRMKNTLAMVRAIATQTLSSDQDLAETKKNFLARIAALDDAQSVLTRGDWERAAISKVITTAITPHAPVSRFAIAGPDLELSSKCAMGLALGLHELATNALKYGALREPAGQVMVNWSVADDRFRLHWSEQGGPGVSEPTRKGFGTRVIEKALAGYFNGTATILYNADGLRFALDAPASELTAD